MKRLTENGEANSPLAYDGIYQKRKDIGVDEFDHRRWKRLLKHFRGGKLADLGCLDSLIPKLAHEKYPHSEVWGLDLAEKAIEDMRKEYPFAFFEVGDVYSTQFPPRYFDYVVAGELMEHLDDPAAFLKEAFRILKRGGTLALSTPKEEAVEPGAVDAERHLWSFSVDDIYELLEPYGQVTIEVLGSRYFPIYKYAFPSIIAYCKKYGHDK